MTKNDSQQERHLTKSERLEAGFDPRLADVWLAIFQYVDDPGRIAPDIGPFLRMAYLSGYSDGIGEKKSGEVLAEIGEAL